MLCPVCPTLSLFSFGCALPSIHQGACFGGLTARDCPGGDTRLGLDWIVVDSVQLALLYRSAADLLP